MLTSGYPKLEIIPQKVRGIRCVQSSQSGVSLISLTLSVKFNLFRKKASRTKTKGQTRELHDASIVRRRLCGEDEPMYKTVYEDKRRSSRLFSTLEVVLSSSQAVSLYLSAHVNLCLFVVRSSMQKPGDKETSGLRLLHRGPRNVFILHSQWEAPMILMPIHSLSICTPNHEHRWRQFLLTSVECTSGRRL